MRAQCDGLQLERVSGGLKTLVSASQSRGGSLRVPWLGSLVPTRPESEHAREQASFGSVKIFFASQRSVGPPYGLQNMESGILGKSKVPGGNAERTIRPYGPSRSLENSHKKNWRCQRVDIGDFFCASFPEDVEGVRVGSSVGIGLGSP